MARVKTHFIHDINQPLDAQQQSELEEQQAKSEKCDLCGLEIKGQSFPVTDENFNKQSGLKQCDRCFGGESLPF